jgi:hypothetical protein
MFLILVALHTVVPENPSEPKSLTIFKSGSNRSPKASARLRLREISSPRERSFREPEMCRIREERNAQRFRVVRVFGKDRSCSRSRARPEWKREYQRLRRSQKVHEKNGRESTTPAAIAVGVVVHNMPRISAAIILAPQSQPFT